MYWTPCNYLLIFCITNFLYLFLSIFSFHFVFFLKTLEFYTETLKNCFDKTTEKIIIYIDSIDKSKNVHKNMFDWIPSKLNENVKIILTITSSATNITEFKNDDLLLNQLKCKFENNFINLNQFSNKQWQDVLEFGGGDYYAANGALHLPKEWNYSDEKIPLKAKVSVCVRILVLCYIKKKPTYMLICKNQSKYIYSFQKTLTNYVNDLHKRYQI